MRQEESLEAYRGRLSRALAYVQDGLGGEVSLEGAAAAACFSKYHFHRIFGAALGESFADFVRRLRLDKAAYFLAQRPSMSVTEVAMAAGFSSPSVLARLFAERFGMPPSRWREERLAATRADRAAGEGLPALWGGQGGERPTGKEGGDELSVRELPALRFASCIHLGPYGPGIQEAWDRLCRWAGPRGLLGGGGRAAGVSWDNPELCPPELCRYSACLEIPPGVEPSGEVLLLEFPARTYLVLRVSGDGVDFSAAYNRLYGLHLPRSGFEPEDSPAIELYRSLASAGSFDLDIALPVRHL